MTIISIRRTRRLPDRFDHMKPSRVPNHTAYTFRKTFTLGTRSAFSMYDDPIHIAFVLARYKFCARMLAGKRRVLEVGCGDAIGTPIVAEFVNYVKAIELEERLVRSNKKRLSGIANITFATADFLSMPPEGGYDGVFSIDVFEHIAKKDEDRFLRTTCRWLAPHGICIVGTPNITARRYASRSSRGHHDNLQSFDGLRATMSRFFHNVFVFSMNDEVVHTGFGPMAHYLLGMGVGVKEKRSSYA